jgi:hypothetical protein
MRKLLTITTLVVCLLSAFLTVNVASAHAATTQPTSCTYWSTDAGTYGPNNGYQ